MRALILDDSQERHDAIKKTFGSQMEIVSCLRFSEAAGKLHEDFDVIFLDHDLGDLVSDPDTEHGMYSSRALNGADFADLMARKLNGREKPDVVIISVNPSGAANIQRALESEFFCARAPFPECLKMKLKIKGIEK